METPPHGPKFTEPFAQAPVEPGCPWIPLRKHSRWAYPPCTQNDRGLITAIDRPKYQRARTVDLGVKPRIPPRVGSRENGIPRLTHEIHRRALLYQSFGRPKPIMRYSIVLRQWIRRQRYHSRARESALFIQFSGMPDLHHDDYLATY